MNELDICLENRIDDELKTQLVASKIYYTNTNFLQSDQSVQKILQNHQKSLERVIVVIFERIHSHALCYLINCLRDSRDFKYKFIRSLSEKFCKTYKITRITLNVNSSEKYSRLHIAVFNIDFTETIIRT